jgi:hypothetical protein
MLTKLPTLFGKKYKMPGDDTFMTIFPQHIKGTANDVIIYAVFCFFSPY